LALVISPLSSLLRFVLQVLYNTQVIRTWPLLLRPIAWLSS
jgi:hypothetical protein